MYSRSRKKFYRSMQQLHRVHRAKHYAIGTLQDCMHATTLALHKLYLTATARKCTADKGKPRETSNIIMQCPLYEWLVVLH